MASRDWLGLGHKLLELGRILKLLERFSYYRIEVTMTLSSACEILNVSTQSEPALINFVNLSHNTNTNTNKNLYRAVIHKKNESEALFGPLGGKQVSFKFRFKSTVVNRGSDASRKTVPNSGCCYSKRTRRSYSVCSRLLQCYSLDTTRISLHTAYLATLAS